MEDGGWGVLGVSIGIFFRFFIGNFEEIFEIFYREFRRTF